MNTTKENLCKIEIDFFQNTEDQCVERVLRFDGKEMLRDRVPVALLKSLDDEVMRLFKRFDPEGQLLRK